MKKNNVQKNQTMSVRHTTGQKILGIFALVGLFACGVMVGHGIRDWQNGPQTLSVETTESGDSDDLVTCQVIENMLQRWIAPEDEMHDDSHIYNIETYKKMIAHGCPENREKYRALIVREQEILAALAEQENLTQTCNEIEALLLRGLPPADNDSDNRIARAKIYANLSERGCAPHMQQYVDLAARELEIARALRDDYFNQGETVAVVETYKRLEMKQAANEVLDKVRKLTDPAIDFILQVQKIIEE